MRALHVRRRSSLPTGPSPRGLLARGGVTAPTIAAASPLPPATPFTTVPLRASSASASTLSSSSSRVFAAAAVATSLAAMWWQHDDGSNGPLRSGVVGGGSGLGWRGVSCAGASDDDKPPAATPDPKPEPPVYTTPAAVVAALKPRTASVRHALSLSMDDFPRLLVIPSSTSPGFTLRLTSGWDVAPPDAAPEAALRAIAGVVESACQATPSTASRYFAALHTPNTTVKIRPTSGGAPWMYDVEWHTTAGVSEAELSGVVRLFSQAAESMVAYRRVHATPPVVSAPPRASGAAPATSKREAALKKLAEHGVLVSEPVAGGNTPDAPLPYDWSCLAGADSIRREVEDTILLPQKHPGVYKQVRELTRARPEQHGAAHLFEGPPGTGKTTTARIIAAASNVPLVVLSFENVGSMYHGESERKMKEVLVAVSDLSGCVLFVDEAESFFPSRGSMRGASHNIAEKGFKTDPSRRCTVVFATNRQQDLDAALLSRITSVVEFKLPDVDSRVAIWKLYAAHLPASDLRQLAVATPGFAGRDIRKVAEVVEKRHTAALLRDHATGTDDVPVTPPPLDLYTSVVEERAGTLVAADKKQTTV